MLRHVDIVDEDDKITKVDINSLSNREKKRIEDLYRIFDQIEEKFNYESVGTNHLVLTRKNTGERIELCGITEIFRWCVCYVTEAFTEDCIPISRLHLLPAVLIQRALYLGSTTNDQ